MSWGASAPPSRGESRKFPEVLSWPFSLFGFARGPPPGGASALLLQGAASSKLPRRTGAAIVFPIPLPVNVKGFSSPLITTTTNNPHPVIDLLHVLRNRNG